jgi:four helix bundle protein
LGFFDVDECDTLLKVREISGDYKAYFQQRLLDFSINTIKLLMQINKSKETDVIRYQLSKSATSIGANFEEAQSSSDREFLHKLRLALKEANESVYWYKIIERLDVVQKHKIIKLKSEAIEISLILGSTVARLIKKQK